MGCDIWEVPSLLLPWIADDLSLGLDMKLVPDLVNLASVVGCCMIGEICVGQSVLLWQVTSLL